MKTIIATGLLLLAIAGCSSPAGTANTPAPTAGTSSAPAPTAGTSSPADSASPSSSPAADATMILVRDFSLDPKDVSADGTVSLAVTNEGPTIHNVAIRDASGSVVGTTKDLKEGESETLTVDIPSGLYALFCSLPGHESLGIKGTLTVGQ